MKYSPFAYIPGQSPSLPARGAWIEIGFADLGGILLKSRSPHGERGLKFGTTFALAHGQPSLPARGAWIEIVGEEHPETVDRSLPPRGAWIEIVIEWIGTVLKASRSPHGERGLKSSHCADGASPQRSLHTRGMEIETFKAEVIHHREDSRYRHIRARKATGAAGGFGYGQAYFGSGKDVLRSSSNRYALRSRPAA